MLSRKPAGRRSGLVVGPEPMRKVYWMVVFPGSGPRHLDIAQLEKWWAGEWVLPAVFSTTHNLVKVHYGFCPVNFTCCFEGFAWEWWGSVLLTSGSTCNHQSWCLWVVDGGVPKGMLRWCWVIVYRRIAYISTFSWFKHFKSCLPFIFQVSFLRVRERTFGGDVADFNLIKFKSSFVAFYVAFRWVEKSSDVFCACVSGMDVLGKCQMIPCCWKA